MINVVSQENVNDAFEEALWIFKIAAKGKNSVQETRNGKAIVLPDPLVTVLHSPKERVIFWDKRDANPFLHLMESLWMLAGRNDVGFPAHFAKKFYEFSDDHHTLNGAYGFRWRHYFGYDQLPRLIDLLRREPNTRRAVLQMWHPNDLGANSKDIPCNLSIAFDLREGRLNSYISNRSNDIVWGLYGANAVHFSILQEYVASCLGVEVGRMTTFSINAHAYTWLGKLDEMLLYPVSDNRYFSGEVGEPYPLMRTEKDTWDSDLRYFLSSPGDRGYGYHDSFFTEVAMPMYRAWRSRSYHDTALAVLDDVAADDWRTAAREWIVRRKIRKEEKEAAA